MEAVVKIEAHQISNKPELCLVYNLVESILCMQAAAMQERRLH